tara:strand:+ start:140 stop:538 length:399 start_codon:yes stop_codon:yes gene_type:complete
MIRKNKKFIDPRYFMDEKMELNKQPQQVIKEELNEYLPPGRMTQSTSGEDIQKMAQEVLESELPAATMVDVMAALSEIGHTEGTFTYEYLFRQPSASTARRNAKKILDILNAGAQEEPRDPYADESPYDAGY